MGRRVSAPRQAAGVEDCGPAASPSRRDQVRGPCSTERSRKGGPRQPIVPENRQLHLIASTI